jgi:hypothetical protein
MKPCFPPIASNTTAHILEYKDRAGYGDVINSTDPFVHRVGEELAAAAIAIGRQTIASFDEHAADLPPC